jgi:hypothetical protein
MRQKDMDAVNSFAGLRETELNFQPSREPIRSFAELKDKVQVIPKPRPFVTWSAEGMAIDILGQATVTLSDWLHARLGDLVRERVPMEDVSVVHRNGRCEIRVSGECRFMFKMKITMEGK